MSDHTPHQGEGDVGPPSLLQKYHFLFRRLHSLSGILPVGVFVCMHLFTNAQMVWPDKGETFQHEVSFIHSTPALLFVEITLWGSIAFHAGLGMVYWLTSAKPNVDKYHGKKYEANVRYTLQRVSGGVALIFIFLHIATLRWRWDIGGWFTPFYAEGHQVPGMDHDLADVPLAMPLTAYALQTSWLVVLLYVIGALSVVYHWSNGLWTAAITWGITISKGAQKRWGLACLGLGMALTVFTFAAIIGALNYDMQKDPTAEQKAALEHVLKDYKAASDTDENKG